MALTNGQTRETLANDMWQACKILRRDNNCGGVMEYIEHLAWLLFLRFLDAQEDIWQTEAALEGKTYQRILESDLAWANWARKDWPADDLIQFVHTRLIPSLQSLHGDPFRETISSIFSERNVVVCASGYNLKDVLKLVDEIDFLNQDDVYTMSHVYETLLKRLGNENKVAGEFYTPRPIIRFMVEVIDPQLGETVYDPACGSGGFLAAAFDHIRSHNPDRTIEQEIFLQTQTFYGNEKKAVPALLGMMNLALHGVTSPKIRRRNTLEEPMKTTPAERFDVVLTNPPFGGTENEAVQDNFPVKSNATELLFIEHIMKKLKSGAGKRCAMVVPEGTLFGGGAFATVKKDLLEQFNLFMVVSLPPGSFAPYADVKTALLFFDRPGPTKEVLYYELPIPEGLKKFSKGSPIGDEHFDELRLVWQRWNQYRLQGGERPFGLAAELREQWRVHRLWEAYRSDKTGKLPKPQASAGDSEVAIKAHQEEGPNPTNQVNAWVERYDDIQNRGFDLTTANPHSSPEQDILKPWELTTSILERLRELNLIVEELHHQLSNGESTDE